MLKLNSEVVEKLFQPSVNGIIQLLNEAINRVPLLVKNCLKYIFIVGGYAQSQMVQNEIRKFFNLQYQVSEKYTMQ